MEVDMVISGGRIYTGELGLPTAEALAIHQGRILAVGSEAEVMALSCPSTRTVRLGGRTVIPGMIDSHLHLLSFGLSLNAVNLQGVASVPEALRRVAARADRTPPGEWIEGSGWDRNLFGRLPTREELDAVSPSSPVLLASKDLHSLWVNSRALAAAGITADTKDPAGGEVVRDAAGAPTGVLREEARRAVFDAVPSPSPERAEVAIGAALKVAAAAGLTGLQTFESSQTLRALQALRRRGKLSLRVCCHLWAGGFLEAANLGLEAGFGDEWLRLGHLKLFLDGALGSHTAYMIEPYAGTADRGIQTMTGAEFRSLVLEAASAGIPVAVHAIGDAANRIALDVLEETSSVWRPRGLRPRIEHVQLLHPADAGRLGRIGVVASMQPVHAPSDWQVAERHWGDRSALAYAWSAVVGSGAVLAFGSDCPVEPINPLWGIHAAVTRQTRDGRPEGGWHPEQRISALDALRAYSYGAAYSSGEEDIKGTLGVGKLADFVLLSGDPFAGPPERLLEIAVEATVVGGELVHGAL